MHDFWVGLWTVVWFAGMGVFALLSILVIYFGGFDLVALLTSLRARHAAAMAEEVGSDSSSEK